jgi:hypothetical protein
VTCEGGTNAEGEPRRLEDGLTRAQVARVERLPDLMEGQSTHRAWVEEDEACPLQSSDPIEMPPVGNALELVLTGVLERKSGARHEILHGL